MVSRSMRFAACLAAAAVTVPVASFASPATASGPSLQRQAAPAAVAAPDWQTCFADVTVETGAVYECATLAVPRDHDRPGLGTIDIALTRIPAADATRRIGSILLNPGGPGGSGIDFVLGFGPAVGFVLGPDIPQQFDLVGFDPRGIGLSTPIRCFADLDQAFRATPPVPFPLTRTEIRQTKDAAYDLGRACRNDPEARRIGQHLSTANVARDMDLIRAAVGDEQLNYLGLSYGTFLGATYANLFPDRVRSVVVDGVLDPIAWVNDGAEVPFSTRLRSDEGAAETLVEFFTQCEAAVPGNCAFAPDSASRFDALAQSMLESPRIVTDPESGESFPVTYQDLIGLSLGVLYNPFDYSFLAQIYAELEAAEPAGGVFSAPVFDALERFTARREPYPNFVEGFPAVGCLDTNNPRNFRAWERAGAAADAEYGYFGRIWTWASSPCAAWPFSDDDRYEGPFDATTSNPVLVIGNLYDPATRYEGAQTLRSLLSNSALLTVDVPGHTSLGLSHCAGAITGAYLLDPAVAADVDGLTCPPEFNAFDVFADLQDSTTGTTGTGPNEQRRATPSTADMEARADIRAMLDDTAMFVPSAIAD